MRKQIDFNLGQLAIVQKASTGVEVKLQLRFPTRVRVWLMRRRGMCANEHSEFEGYCCTLKKGHAGHCCCV